VKFYTTDKKTISFACDFLVTGARAGAVAMAEAVAMAVAVAVAAVGLCSGLY